MSDKVLKLINSPSQCTPRNGNVMRFTSLENGHFGESGNTPKEREQWFNLEKGWRGKRMAVGDDVFVKSSVTCS